MLRLACASICTVPAARTPGHPLTCRLVFLPLLLLLLLQVSWDFHNAAKHGFTLLQQQIKQLSFQD
jgi:hypothetical protein